MLTRRNVLVGLGGVLAAACGPKATAAPVERTPTAVTGPFPPPAFVPRLRGRDNPGPRFEPGEHDMDLAQVDGVDGVATGQIVVLTGRVLTASGTPVHGARVQLWQADTQGFYNHENERPHVKPADLDKAFGYWGEITTDADGAFRTRTIVPGAYPAGEGWWRPPHLHWKLDVQGASPLITQSYFDGDVIGGIETIRQLNRDDLILNVRDTFAQGLSVREAEVARERTRKELVVAFAPGEGGVPTGELTLRV